MRTMPVSGSATWRAIARPIRDEKTLEDFLVNRFGRELYATFFRDYTRKVWGRACEEIPAEWGAQRIKGLSITRALGHALKKVVIPGGRAVTEIHRDFADRVFSLSQAGSGPDVGYRGAKGSGGRWRDSLPFEGDASRTKRGDRIEAVWIDRRGWQRNADCLRPLFFHDADQGPVRRAVTGADAISVGQIADGIALPGFRDRGAAGVAPPDYRRGGRAGAG